MAKNQDKLQLQLNIELDQADHSVFGVNAGKGGLQAFLKGCIETYLHQYANGGVMISPEEVGLINKSLPTPISSSEDIVSALKPKGRVQSGASTVPVVLDPTIMTPLMDAATFRGISVDDLIAECWGHILANGWLLDMSTDCRWVPFSRTDVEKIKKITGLDDVISTSIMKALEKK